MPMLMPITQSDRCSNRGASRYLFRSLLFLLTLTALSASFHQPLIAAFLTNPYLNCTIAVAFLLGVSYTLKVMMGTLLDVRAADQATGVALKALRHELPLKQADEALLGNIHRRGVSDFCIRFTALSITATPPPPYRICLIRWRRAAMTSEHWCVI